MTFLNLGVNLLLLTSRSQSVELKLVNHYSSMSDRMFELQQILLVNLPGCPASVVGYLGRPCFLTARHTWKIDEIQHQSPVKETAEVSKMKKAIKHRAVCSNVLAASICVHLHVAEGKVDYRRIMFLSCCTAWPVWPVAAVRRCCSVGMLMFLLVEGICEGVWGGDLSGIIEAE